MTPSIKDIAGDLALRWKDRVDTDKLGLEIADVLTKLYAAAAARAAAVDHCNERL